MSARLRLAAPVFLTAAAVAAFGAPEAGFNDSVDLEVAYGATVRGTIRSVAERESFRMQLPRGATVRAAARRKGKGRFVPRVDLADDADQVLGTGIVKGAGAKLTAPAAPADGSFRLRVFGDGVTDGDYTCSFSARPQTKWHGDGTAAAGGGPVTFTFPAPAGARAKVTLRAPRGSAFVPALDAISDPSDAALHALTGASTGFLPLAATGTYTVTFHDAGGAGGEWTCDVLLRPAKTRAAKIDISAGALTGAFVDDQPVYGRLAGDGADLLVDPPDFGGPLDGVSISLQPGSLPFPVALTMGEVDPFALPDGQSPAGAAIRFGPDGTTFAEGKPATLTLSYDAGLFTDPANEMTVWVMDERTGERLAVPKPYEFPAPGIVRFTTAHFSSYVPAREGTVSPVGDWEFLSVRSQPEADWGGEISMSSGTVTFLADRTFQLSLAGARSRWIRAFDDGQSVGPRVEEFPEYGYDTGGWAEPGGLALDVLTGGEETVTLSRSRYGHFIVVPAAAGEPEADLGWMLRRARGRPTHTTIAGRWHMIALRALARDTSDAGNRRARLELEAVRGTATFAADGAATYRAARLGSAGTDYPSGLWEENAEAASAGGRIEISGSHVLLYMDDEDGGEPDLEARLSVCLGGDVLAGVGDTSRATPQPTMWILLREGSKLGPSVLAGVTSATGAGFETIDRPGGVQGIGVYASAVGVTHESSRSARVDVRSLAVHGHDSEGLPETRVSVPPSETFTYTLSPSGAYATSTGIAGAVSRDGRLFVGTQSGGGRFELFLGVPGEDILPLR